MATYDELNATVSAFVAYIALSQPQLNESEVIAEVKRMLRVVGWSEDAIAYWIDDVFGEDRC